MRLKLKSLIVQCANRFICFMNIRFFLPFLIAKLKKMVDDATYPLRINSTYMCLYTNLKKVYLDIYAGCWSWFFLQQQRWENCWEIIYPNGGRLFATNYFPHYFWIENKFLIFTILLFVYNFTSLFLYIIVWKYLCWENKMFIFFFLQMCDHY